MSAATQWPLADNLAQISRLLDEANRHRPDEARTWGRLAKITEEAGEVVSAYIGMTGQNPRKGITHQPVDVCEELLDVAITALGALEHMTGNGGRSICHLEHKADEVRRRLEAIDRREQS